MRISRLAIAVAAATCCGTIWALQQTADFGFGNDDSPTNVKAEFYWSRLAYSSRLSYAATPQNFGGSRGRWFNSWSRDYSKEGRQFLIAMQRLTSIDGRPTEQVVTLNSDEIFNYPWIYAVQVERWSFTDEEAKRLRDYLQKGGFLMVDDFHGTEDWENFMNGMRQVLPDRPVEDLQSGDEIFHTLYDIDVKMQIPGEQYVCSALGVACVAAAGADCCRGRRAGAAGPLEDEGGRTNASKLEGVGGVGDAVGVCGAGAAAAVAAGDDGCGVEFAAEHHRGGGG